MGIKLYISSCPPTRDRFSVFELWTTKFNGRIMANTNLTNQRQVFVEEYVRSGDHLEAAKKAGYKDTHTLLMLYYYLTLPLSIIIFFNSH